MSVDLEKMPKLGFGLMRLPEKDGAVDIKHVCRMVDHYMKMDKRYFDTAYVYHGVEILDAHPEVEFVQIQLNYLDRTNPVVQSQALYEILHERNIPIIVMEPVRGGMLANMAPEIEEKFKAKRPDASVASWALRFVASLPGVMTVLSGMSNEEQILDNIKTFTDFEPIDEEELNIINEVTEEILSIPQHLPIIDLLKEAAEILD